LYAIARQKPVALQKQPILTVSAGNKDNLS
jgi:hypothetical protein